MHIIFTDPVIRGTLYHGCTQR